MSPRSAPKPTPPSADADGLGELVRRALAEDAAFDDVTTRATVPEGAAGRARLIARQRCVLAGLDAFELAMTALDPAVRVRRLTTDGQVAAAGETVVIVDGPLSAILSAERTALNFVQRAAGIATLTRAFVDAAAGVTIRDTRKTTPGLRAFEKAAVRAGGGQNHRSDLGRAVLIKDNHVAAAGSVTKAIEGARALADVPIQVECDTLEQVREALDAGARSLLLDNMDAAMLREAVALVDGRAFTEASGGITLEQVRAIAVTGVDAISVGALTHSAPAIDLALEVE